MATALVAGINPANAPLIINILNAFIATHKSTVGFKNISPLSPIKEFNNSNNPIPNTNPKYPDMDVKKMASKTICPMI